MAIGDASKGRFGILVGGGPAPGINGVIAGAGIEALDSGYQVVGLFDGFESICQDRVELKENLHPSEYLGHPAKLLGYPDLTRIHWEGGSILRTSRKRPKDEELEVCARNLRALGVRHLITIGGDDTMGSSGRLSQITRGEIRVAHVPKTIDNDLPLPANTPTFGFSTARHRGTEIISSLLYDAKATRRWYFVIMMGRSAGFLALGTATGAGATCAIIPEELRQDITIDDLADMIIGSMLVRRAEPRPRMDGVAVIAEGVTYRLSEESLKWMEAERYAKLDRDEHGHIKLANIELGRAIQAKVTARLGKKFCLAEKGPSLTDGIVVKDVGYELRSCHPIPFDIEYTRGLGYSATRFLVEGGNECLISLVNGHTNPIPYSSVIDPKTKKVPPRVVDISAETYRVARKYMLRLEPEHLTDPQQIANLLAVAGKMTEQELKQRFSRVLEIDVGHAGK